MRMRPYILAVFIFLTLLTVPTQSISEHIAPHTPSHPVSCLFGIANGLGIGALQQALIIKTADNLDLYGLPRNEPWSLGHEFGDNHPHAQRIIFFLAGIIATEASNIAWHTLFIHMWRNIFAKLNTRAVNHGYTYGRALWSLGWIFGTYVDDAFFNEQEKSHILYSELGELANTAYYAI